MDSDQDQDSGDERENLQSLLHDLSAITKQMVRDITIANHVCPLEVSRVYKLETELNDLKEKQSCLERELVSMKRKRWCCWCLKEAIFLSNDRFYCSSRCEQLDELHSKC